MDLEHSVGPATIDDVAARAGVSVATVSRALRGLPNVSPVTAQRVRDAADSLDYVPAPFAAGLASGKTRTVAIAVPMLNSWYFSQVMAGAEALLATSGYDLLIFAIDTETTRRRVLRNPLIKRADGLIMVDIMATADETRALVRQGLPVVTVGFEIEGVSSVVTDDTHVGRLATEHLLALGHERIGVLAGRSHSAFEFTVPGMRLDGHRSALADAGVPVRPDYQQEGDFSVDGGRDAMRRLLALAEPPTAVFAMSDEMAFGALRSIREAGREVPDDISIVGVDDHELAAVLSLTTVNQPVLEHGEIAAQILLDGFADPGHRPVRREPTVALVERETTAPPPRHPPH